jgi:hypothetical protein
LGEGLVRDGANAGWINYMLKDRQKSEFDGFLDCEAEARIIIPDICGRSAWHVAA